MQELTALFQECINRYGRCLPCDRDSCKLGFYCTAHDCSLGNCDSCMNHIQRATTPDFHYACAKITYHYVLRFFNRFASEIAYIMNSAKTTYFQRKTRLNVVSLGCGPGSEVYGFIKSLRSKAPHIVLNYKGYDLNTVWSEVQQLSVEALSQTPHRIEFHNMNMFGAFTGFDEGEVDMLVLNYLLSDSQKYYNDTDKLKFINEIVHFIIENNVNFILFNDMGYYGNGGLDSGVGMMLRLIRELEKTNKVSLLYRCFPSDRYIPSTTWKPYQQESLLFQRLPNNTFDVNITCCRSKQILVGVKQ